jgi:3-hydroxyisobutyrate dehydrogenase-like beta-hydroxyacid dehydrogenase
VAGTTVAVVGTGRMGSAMARALTAAGLPLVLQNRTRPAAERLAAELGGGRVVDTPAEAAAAADIVITMLANDAAVRSAFLDPGGLVVGAGPGNVLVDMSTVEPSTILSVAPAVRATGAGLLDAPVSGSVHLAAAGTLTIMVGGDEADLTRARPALEALARTIFHLGPLGTGAAMKLAVNILIFAINASLSEAIVLSEAAGIPRAQAYEVIAASAAGAPYVAYKRAAFLDPEATPVGFALELADKDLRLISDTAARLGLELPQTRATHQLIQEAISHGHAADDLAAIATELRSRRQPPAGPQGEGTSD